VYKLIPCLPFRFYILKRRIYLLKEYKFQLESMERSPSFPTISNRLHLSGSRLRWKAGGLRNIVDARNREQEINLYIKQHGATSERSGRGEKQPTRQRAPQRTIIEAAAVAVSPGRVFIAGAMAI